MEHVNCARGVDIRGMNIRGMNIRGMDIREVAKQRGVESKEVRRVMGGKCQGIT